MVWSLGTSAFLTLITLEAESHRRREWLAAHDSIWSSQLLSTEAARAAVHLGVDLEVVEGALGAVSPVLSSATTFFVAGRLEPWSLRSLDALHLATALEIGDDLEGIVVYDERLAGAARAASLALVVPG